MTRAPLLALVVLAVVAAAHAAPPPHATITHTGAVTVTLPLSVLQSAEVKKHLTSGLTTAFVITVVNGRNEGGARLTVRYELWEEKYFVSVFDAAGAEQKHTFDSQERLASWWSAAAWTVFGQRTKIADAPMEITLRVLPFSAREQAETQKWLSRMLTSMESVKDQPVGERSDAGAGKIFAVIVGTSIQRRPILEHRWTVQARRVP